ncbi:uncharacterized protein TNCV_352981 [Trichonephila clavipes]|nr:uncharacterized protein TNCV_352981 [Trichonephila clavipes]
MRCIGQGLESLKTFCAVMSLPNPVEQKSHDVINNKLSPVMKEVAEESMKMAAVEEYSSSPDNLLTVSGDGTWKTRGHSSLIGVCTVIGAETSKVLDREVLSSFCKGCDSYKGVKFGIKYNKWQRAHKISCRKNYSGSAGDGDTKTFNALSENKPYGDDHLIQKIECVGHVQKRMGTRLRKLKLVYSKKKLSDGKTIGGKGRLTDSLIDKLAHYYGNAIRCNSTSVKEMRKAIWAVWGHSCSTDDEPMHWFCPTNPNTWFEKNKYENGTFAQTKIPPIILPTFSGKYEQFSNFKSQFDDLITTNEQLTQSQKLYYLNSCLSNEVKEFASTFDTFSSLYEALESRYDNKRLIVYIHVQQILNFKKIERENPKEIREMIDCIKKNLRALKLLNYEQNNLFNVFLLNIMLKKLDNESRKNFELRLNAKHVPTFDEFIAFLEQRETILLSVDKNCIVETKTILRKPSLSFKTKTNLLMNQTVENKSCIASKDKTSHPIFRCKKFLELNPEKRLDLVRLHMLCELCLRKNHKRMQCTSTYMCPCSNKHSRSLCTAAIGDRRKGAMPSAELPVLTNPGDRESDIRGNVVGVLVSRRETSPPIFGTVDNDSVEDTLKLFFELESLGIKDDLCYRKDDQAMNIFKETVQYNNNRYSLNRRLSLRIICPNLEYLGILLLTANLTLDSKWSSVKREYEVLIIFFVENVDSHGYLATGDLMASSSYLFRIGRSTTSAIIKETCEAISSSLKPIVLAKPDRT